MYKHSTKEFRIKCAKEAIEACKNGVTYTATAKKLKVSVKSLWNWTKSYENGKLKGPGDHQSDFEIPGTLLESVTNDFKKLGALEVETIRMMVFIGDIKDKNFLIVNVENPEITDPDKYDKELKRRIWEKLGSELKYGFATVGFKLLEETDNGN